MTQNVTRIHPSPSIPNPLMANPWAELSDSEINDGLFAAQVRIDAARHTVASLTREKRRRVREAMRVTAQAPVPEVRTQDEGETK